MRMLTILTGTFLGLVAYHYVGYPLVLVFWAFVRRRPIAGKGASPSVSLVISAYNEERVIREKVENSLDLDYPDLEILVVSDGSTDSTPEVVAGYAGRGVVGLHEPERMGKGHAMNRAAAAAHGEILVFSDANALYAPGAVRRLVRWFGDPNVGIVTGRKTVLTQEPAGRPSATGASEGFYWRYESFLKRKESEVGSTVAVVGEMLAVRRDLFEPIPPDVINDDAFLGLSVLNRGYRVLFEPEAICWEEATARPRDDRVRRRRMTAGRWQLVFRPGWLPWSRPGALFQLLSHKVLRLLLPLALIGALVANGTAIVLPGTPRWLMVTGGLQAVFYLLAIAGVVCERSGRVWRPAALAFFIVNGNIGSLLGLFSYLRGRQDVLWSKARL